MANCCIVTFEVNFDNEVDKNNFFDCVDKEFAKDKEEFLGSDLGSKYIFDCEISDSNTMQCIIVGWVKNFLSADDLRNFIQKYNRFNIKSVIVNVEEISNWILGRYEYSDNHITEYFVLPQDFKDNNIKYLPTGDSSDEEYDSYLNALKDILNNHKEKLERKDYTI